jgi:AcrR family transcriptional regulator
VPAATLYRLFTSKAGVLKALLDTSIAGDEEPVAVGERPDVASRFAAPDPAELLTGITDVTVAINQRTNDLYRVLMGAADSDPAAAALLDELRDQRDRGQRRVVTTLRRNGSLRPGVAEREAADLVHALMSPEVYRLLVVDRRWSPERYRTWLVTTLAQQLL